jgi:hypothetical protein
MYSIVFVYVCVCMHMQCKWPFHDNRRPDPGTPTVSDSVSVTEEACREWIAQLPAVLARMRLVEPCISVSVTDR